MCSDIFGRELNPGDFVLFSTQKGDISLAKHGIVVSSATVFVGDVERVGWSDKHFRMPSSVYRIDVLDEEQQKVYNELNRQYKEYLYKKVR